MWLQIKRTIKFAINNIAHNYWLAIATIGSIAIALFIINVQIANLMANNLLLEDIQNKVNISVYLKPEVNDEAGREIARKIESYPEVEKVNYVSKEEAFEKFKKDTANNQVLQEALDEVGDNPLGITLNVKARNSEDYPKINEKIKQDTFQDKIESINYEEYKGIISNLNEEIRSSQKITIILAVILSLIAVLITFSTITITIYTHRKEIEIMKLVGGSNFFVSAPFVWEGIIYGVIAAVISTAASYGYLQYIIKNSSDGSLLSLSSARFIKQFLETYLIRNWAIIILSQLLAGIFLGVTSSLISIRKYLKI